MANEQAAGSTASPPLHAALVYGTAVMAITAGLSIGYVLRGCQSPSTTQPPVAITSQPADQPSGDGQLAGADRLRPAVGMPGQPSPHAAMAASGTMGKVHVPSLAEMKQIADKQVAPLLEKLKTDPSNTETLVQVGAIYNGTHQFKEASVYYGKAVQVEPKNIASRTRLASSLYRSGDVDGAIAELNRALSYGPNDANALFDLGLIKLQGKQDGKGALAAWQKLLKTNPQLSEERRATVQKLMADVMTTLADQHATGGARSDGGH